MTVFRNRQYRRKHWSSFGLSVFITHQTGGYEDPSGFTSYLTVGDDKTPFNYDVTSGRGMRLHPKSWGHTGCMKALTMQLLLVHALMSTDKHLSTWEDKGGGIMSQYGIKLDDGSKRELLLLHGSSRQRYYWHWCMLMTMT